MTAALDPATVDLLGVLAYGELTASERLANDAQLAPSIEDKIALGTMAHGEFGHFLQLRDHLLAAGVDPVEAMRPFVAALTAFHDATQPSDWLEGLIKAYVGDGMASDFYREASAYVQDEPTRTLIRAVLADAGKSSFAVARVREAIAAEPALGGRLALWARRLVGEAILQAQQVAVERDALLELLVGSGDLAGISRLFTTITDKHTERMHTLGLQA
jgi:1,2-phenylacetyl-CoA epoxidase catalytic subunit